MSGLVSRSQKFGLGLVVGKFAPLHLGHEWLIREAAHQCDRLLILSYTCPEFSRCGPDIRRTWLARRFAEHEVEVLDQNSLERKCMNAGIAARPLPPNDAPDDVHQEFLAWLLRRVLRRNPDALFSSESYGPACAEVLSKALRREVRSVLVDPQRMHFPCSGSEIRREPGRRLHWLSPEVRASFVKRVAIVGGESSGKTTLARALAEHFNTSWVPEYGRELWEQQGGKLSEPDLLKIAVEQIRREDVAAMNSGEHLFCDTSPLTTAGYGLWMFGRIDAELRILASREYDAVILCEPDFPFVQDGTRRDDDFRLRQHAWYEEMLESQGCRLLRVKGDLCERVAHIALNLSSRAAVNRIL